MGLKHLYQRLMAQSGSECMRVKWRDVTEITSAPHLPILGSPWHTAPDQARAISETLSPVWQQRSDLSD